MNWLISNRADPEARIIADRHYNRQKIGSPQFVPPGRCLVLKTTGAFWVTSWPYAQYVKHRWAGAWICSAFRRESPPCDIPASQLIKEALEATRFHFGEPPELGLITFINTKKVKPIHVRNKPTFGRTWILSGFFNDGCTQGGLLCFRILPEKIPQAVAAIGDK